jgi:hypothetical protein
MSVRMMTILASLSRRQSPTLILLICMTLLGGCATFGVEQSTPPVTVSEVIQMSKAGVPADTILDKMRESQTVYRLTASQLAQLRDQGVANQVIDYMQQTYLYAVRNDQSLEDWDDWTLGADGFWYGGPYYGWRPVGGSETMDIAYGETEGNGGTETEGMKVNDMASMESTRVKAMASTEGMKVEAMARVEAMAAVAVAVEGMAEGKN